MDAAQVEKYSKPWQGEFKWRVFFGYLAAAIAFRYLCHSLMLIPVLLNELRSAPTVPDCS